MNTSAHTWYWNIVAKVLYSVLMHLQDSDFLAVLHMQKVTLVLHCSEVNVLYRGSLCDIIVLFSHTGDHSTVHEGVFPHDGCTTQP